VIPSLIPSDSLASENQPIDNVKHCMQIVNNVFLMVVLIILQGNEGAYDKLVASAEFKSYVFKIRAKMETYNVSNRKTECIKRGGE